MSLQTQREEHTDILFLARVDNVRNISQILRAVNFKDQATFYCTENGLKVTVEDFKCVQASAFIQFEVFQEYIINKKENNDLISFKINLSVVLECLNIFGTSSSGGSVSTMKMSYKGYGFPLEMLVEEDGVITNCTVKTQTAEEILDFNFDQSASLNKVILKSDAMKEVMNDLDTSSDVIEIYLSPDPPYFRLSTAGDCGDSQTEIPKDCEMIDSFNCTSLLSFCYKFCHVKPSMKPLLVSNKVSVRIDERGLLCFQYMIRTEDNHVCFVEYYCTPVVQSDDDSD